MDDTNSIEVLSLESIQPEFRPSGAALECDDPGQKNLEYFLEIQGTPPSLWLKDVSPAESYPYQVMQYFREVSEDMRQWLAQYQDQHKVRRLEIRNELIWVQCIQFMSML